MDQPCILVIDDEPRVGELLVHSLATGGYAARHCPSGQEALQLLLHSTQDACSRPALVLLDLEMPAMDGEVFLQRLRAGWDPALGRLPPVLVLSAKLDLPRPEQLGVQEVLPKPFHLQAVLGAVRALLGSAQTEGPAAGAERTTDEP